MLRPNEPQILFIDGEGDNSDVLQMFRDNQLGAQLVHLKADSPVLESLLDHSEPRVKLPGLILLDLVLPKGETIRMLRKIKTHPRLSSVPFAVIVADNDPNVQAYYQLGINYHFAPPLTFGVFARAMILLGLFEILLASTHGESLPNWRSGEDVRHET